MTEEQRSEFRNNDFILLVKRTRGKFNVSISEAHDLIFADEELRRLVATRINRDPECRKMAMRDLRAKGDSSRFVLESGKIRFRTA